MSRENGEMEFDDEVYEDSFYEDDEEELEDESELVEVGDDDDQEEVEEKKIHMSFACEECDYRWEETVVTVKGNLEDEVDEYEGICPMCGSMNVTQI